MNFRTEYIPARSAITLDPARPLLLIGSCFSENVGRILADSGWDAAINPCGTLFNPASIERIAGLALDPAEYGCPRSADFGEGSFSWDFPTTFTSPSAARLQEKTSQALGSLAEAVKISQAVIITLGTSIVYRFESDNIPVANCHRIPAARFSRSMLSADETAASLRRTASIISSANPDAKIILTVSPVRHIKEGFADNSRSKARLILACEKMEEENIASYFPAYEILSDDLRDYRFYADDLLHPSSAASEYIAGKFLDTYLDPDGRKLLDEAAAICRRLRHRILNPGNPQSARFREETLRLARSFVLRHPGFRLPDPLE